MCACIQRVVFVIQKSIRTYFEYLPSGPEEGIWTFHVAALGHTRIPAGKPYPPPEHPEGRTFTWERGRVLPAFQLLAISAGRGRLESQAETRILSAGSVFLLPPGLWHRYRPDPTTGWTEDWVELRGPAIDAWLSAGLLDVGPVRLPKKSPLWRWFQELHGICHERAPGYRAVAAGLAMAALASVISHHTASARPKKRGLPGWTRRARELLMEGRDVRNIAHTLGVSYPTFYRKFKDTTGLCPKQYAREIRLARAEDMLARTALSVKEVAAKLGYHSGSHLSLEFKRLRGSAPSKWRKGSSLS